MHCPTVEPRLEDYLDGQVSELERDAIEAHLANCDSCAARLDRERALLQRLQEQAPPTPPPGFAERVLGNAAHQARRRRRQRLGAQLSAAALLLALAGGVLWPESPPLKTIHVARGQPEEVNLVFEARRPMEGVRVTLRIPEGVRLEGYTDRRRISWRTDLRAGRNQLTLPVVVDRPAALSARLEHEQGSKRFDLRLQPREGTPKQGGEPQA